MASVDNMLIFRRRVGNTPLMRCKGLEKRLGLKEVHVKLEGTNPTGHKSDRIAHRIIRDAKQWGYDTITLGTVGYLATSLSALSVEAGMSCIFYVPKVTDEVNDSIYPSSNVQLVETGGTLDKAISVSREQATEKGWYDANPGLENTLFGMIAYSPIAEELVHRLGDAPDSISVPVGTGSLLSGIHLGFRQKWSSEEVERVPRFFGGSLTGANAIVESFARGLREVKPLDNQLDGLDHDLYTLVNLQGLYGQPALEGILDSGGAAYGMDPDELRRLQELCSTTEDLELTRDSAAAIGALARATEEGLVEREGRHVLILSTGRTDLTIEELKWEDVGNELNDMLRVLDQWLEDFSDPIEEIREAVSNALDNGYVLAALLDGKLVGLCVLSTMELDTFFPRYHLSYIAADGRYEGRGVATQLLERAVELTDGNLSLHVERDNEKAIRLYQKMGFDIKYHRMHYRKGEGA